MPTPARHCSAPQIVRQQPPAADTRRSVCICTSRSAGSAATSATSGSTPTRTRARSSSISICWRASGSSTPKTPAVAGRRFNFVYFGGGTPSFLSTKQLQGLVERLNASGAWNHAEEITFECEPGTLTEAKLAAIRDMGVTRLSLGVENFDDRILELNGRAHRSPEIGTRLRSGARARLSADQHRSDRRHARRDRRQLAATASSARWRSRPDSVTIYQMELPYNTTISGDLLKGGGQFAEPVADWATKRRWVQEAFAALERAGYHIGSAYTAVKNPAKTKFVYRDRLWEGADLLGLGVASFGHINGVHVQNLDTWPKYQAAIERGEIPLGRAYRPTDEERMIREFVLQLKRGSNRPSYFAREVRRRRAVSASPARSTRCAATATWPRRAPIASR